MATESIEYTTATGWRMTVHAQGWTKQAILATVGGDRIERAEPISIGVSYTGDGRYLAYWHSGALFDPDGSPAYRPSFEQALAVVLDRIVHQLAHSPAAPAIAAA